MATSTPLVAARPLLLDATVIPAAPAPTDTDDNDPHWHMPADGCDHRTYACNGCCPHGDDTD